MVVFSWEDSRSTFMIHLSSSPWTLCINIGTHIHVGGNECNKELGRELVYKIYAHVMLSCNWISELMKIPFLLHIERLFSWVSGVEWSSYLMLWVACFCRSRAPLQRKQSYYICKYCNYMFSFTLFYMFYLSCIKFNAFTFMLSCFYLH